MPALRTASVSWKVPLALSVLSVAACAVMPGTAEAQAAASPAVLSADTRFHVDPESDAAEQAEAWVDRPEDAASMRYLAGAPVATWLGDWNVDVTSAAREQIEAAGGDTVVLVAYNMVGRDLGYYSAGGASSQGEYRAWIDALAAGLGDGPAVVVVEPDALPHLTALPEDGRAIRLQLLRYAVTTLAARPQTAVYLDAGHAGWHDAATTAALLESVAAEDAAGFSLNVSNYFRTEKTVAYGQAVLAELADASGLGFVVDTSRNGVGPLLAEDDPLGEAGAGERWCNPPGRAVGELPRALPGPAGVDAYLWIKRPGESDGECRGGPAAGSWWPEQALSLVRNAPKLDLDGSR